MQKYNKNSDYLCKNNQKNVWISKINLPFLFALGIDIALAKV